MSISDHYTDVFCGQCQHTVSEEGDRQTLYLYNKTVDAAARALLSLLCSVLREASRFERRELHRLRRRIRGSINFATSNRTVRAAGVVRTAVYLIEKAMPHGNREAYAYTIGGRVEAMRSSLLRHSTFISLTDNRYR